MPPPSTPGEGADVVLEPLVATFLIVFLPIATVIVVAGMVADHLGEPYRSAGRHRPTRQRGWRGLLIL